MNFRLKILNLLHWSEQYTQTDMVYLAKGGFWLVLGQIITSLMGFFLVIAFANLLPKETYGTYKYVIGLSGLLGAFSLNGMTTAVARSVAKGFEGTFIKSLWVQLKWGLLIFMVALGVSLYYFTHDNNTLGIALLIVGCTAPLINSANTYEAFLNGKKNFQLSTKFGIVSSLVCSLAVLATMIIAPQPVFLILAYFTANAAMMVFFCWRTITLLKPNRLEDASAISYGKHLSVMNAANGLAFYLYGPLIFHFLGSAELAIYAMAIALPEQIKAVFKNLSSLILPKASEQTDASINRTLGRKMTVFLLALAISTVAYIILAPFFYQIFFPKYTVSIFYSQLYAISLIATASLLPNTVLQAQAATKKLYYFNIITSVLQIVLLAAFIYWWGLMGAIASRVIARFANLFFSFWLIKN